MPKNIEKSESIESSTSNNTTTEITGITGINVEFSRIVDVLHVGSKGKYYHYQTTGEENKSLAERYNIVAVKALSAECNLIPIKKGKYNLAVTFNAEIIQSCVISLELVEENIAGNFTAILIQEPNKTRRENSEIDFDHDEDDIEYLSSNLIDIGELIAQNLSLEINPYPRKPDATGKELGKEILTEDEVMIKSEKQNPFHVLKSLKHKT
ncbi:MAG: DUF177 domain-containing protein [Emcibacter sp.]|nr:DUF177 domain-containing protein [Emcibacter sp.]